ncbi:MAG: DUF6384 family protein [Isosphaeraceae bacterium]
MSTANTPRAETLSVAEMLRIMDVATALRQDRELVEEQLNLDALKAKLREKMFAAAKVTGENVSQEEVDAAVDQYYARLYAFHEPPMSLPLALAHLYVRRWELGGWAAAIVAVWFLFLSPNGPFTITGRTHQQVVRISSDIERRLATLRATAADDATRLSQQADELARADDPPKLRKLADEVAELESQLAQVAKLKAEAEKSAANAKAIARDPSVGPEVDRLAAEAATYAKERDVKRLNGVVDGLTRMESRLDEEYTVSILAAPGGRSAFTRLMPAKDGKRVSEYYVIVQAKRPDGSLVGRRVHNSENGKDRDVTTWAERVPEGVYRRLEHDKKADGILNETTFAVKLRGLTSEQVVMPAEDGKSLVRLGQITDW